MPGENPYAKPEFGQTDNYFDREAIAGVPLIDARFSPDGPVSAATTHPYDYTPLPPGMILTDEPSRDTPRDTPETKDEQAAPPHVVGYIRLDGGAHFFSDTDLDPDDRLIIPEVVQARLARLQEALASRLGGVSSTDEHVQGSPRTVITVEPLIDEEAVVRGIRSDLVAAMALGTTISSLAFREALERRVMEDEASAAAARAIRADLGAAVLQGTEGYSVEFMEALTRRRLARLEALRRDAFAIRPTRGDRYS